jgi:hypothetical protein
MNPRRAVRLLSATRAFAGVSLITSPRVLPRMVGVDSATAARVSWLNTMIGARELALGAGTLLAMRGGRDVTEWVYAQAVSDLADAVAFSGAVARGHARALPGLGIVAAAAGGLATAAYALRRAEPTG